MQNKPWLLFMSLLIVQFATAQTEIIYPKPAGLKPSVAYQVFVNGQEAFVYDSPIPAAYCSFDMKGPVDILIKANRDIKWVDVRPLAKGIVPQFRDSTIRFTLNQPAKLSIELNGSIRLPLFLFANTPESNRPSPQNPKVRYFAAGKIHYPGEILLQNDETLYIEGGAVVVGVVKAKNARNIRIAGRGMLDGTYNRNFADAVVKTGDTVQINRMQGAYARFIELDRCEDVKIEGITLHNSTSWQVVPINCRRVLIEDIKIIADNPSDDGIDVVHCQDLKIRDCFIRSKDDCVVVKAYQRAADALPVDNIVVENCVFWNALWGNALEVGFELNGVPVKNIYFQNCDIIHVEAGATLSIHNAGRSIVSNVVFDNIRIEDSRQKLFDIAIVRSRYSEDGTEDLNEMRRLYLNGAWDGVLRVDADKKAYHAQFRGKVQDIVFKNIQIVGGTFPYSVFYGFDEQHGVSNVRIENLRVYGKRIKTLADAKLYSENAQGIQLK